jgi:hypothetical protein
MMQLVKMNRRNFLLTGAAGVGLTTVSLLSSCEPSIVSREVLHLPGTAGKFCSEKELIQMGKEYMSAHPDEAGRNRLYTQLLSVLPQEAKTADKKTLAGLLANQKLKDFSNGDVVVLSGWVLSLTEARQCALYTLTRS